MKYNKGAITRPAFEVGNHGRVHNVLWLLRQVLSADSVLLCAWADGKSAQWILRVDDIRGTFGWDDKQWRRVRAQLESIGVITRSHERFLHLQKSVHTLEIDLTVLFELVVKLELEPPAKNGGSREPPERGGSHEPPERGGSHEPPEVEGLTTTNGPEQNDHNHAPPGAGLEGQQVRFAISPAGAGLGARLSDLLTEPEQRRANAASVGATNEQLQRAAAALRGAATAGTVRSVAALAVSLAQRAVRGEVGELAPTAGAPAPAAGVALANPWPARAQLAGWIVEHQRGTLVVQPGALQFQHLGGDRAGQFVGGAGAVRVWDRIDRGELALQPPTPP